MGGKPRRVPVARPGVTILPKAVTKATKVGLSAQGVAARPPPLPAGRPRAVHRHAAAGRAPPARPPARAGVRIVAHLDGVQAVPVGAAAPPIMAPRAPGPRAPARAGATLAGDAPMAPEGPEDVALARRMADANGPGPVGPGAVLGATGPAKPTARAPHPCAAGGMGKAGAKEVGAPPRAIGPPRRPRATLEGGRPAPGVGVG